MNKIYKNMTPYKHIHFIGIGGIGMSALARMFLTHGIRVSGSDGVDSKIIKDLQTEGADIHIGHARENISEDVDCVVYTLAIDNLNEELNEAHVRKLPMYTYAEMLGEVSKDMFTIAVAGTHGKTTTTAMAADVFLKNNKNPHVIVGSLLAQTGSNYIHGKENIFIVEACEYKRSFLNLNPNILLITNIDEDHLDYYKDLNDIHNAFRTLVQKVPKEGFVICDTEDEKVKPVLEGCAATIVDYKKYISEIPELTVLGDHNVLNASLVMALSEIQQFDSQISKQALADFKGTWRRLEFKKDFGALKLYDDYAHHPTEIAAGIQAFKKRFTDLPLIIIFQPHLYSRTKEHFDEFVEVLKKADMTVVLPIYAAREHDDGSINSQMLVDALVAKGAHAQFASDFETVQKDIRENQNNPAIIVTVGAGDVYKIVDSI
ncbi:MAG: UDP-N-acetylmuramate--L-alanine ligase, UDP-N-acetylmuramate--alanine ligase [Candidatus Parcubacteria bacterium]|jgi:UDP-N-acetylmuramate--alanine ligase